MSPDAVKDQVLQALMEIAPEADPSGIDPTQPLRDQLDIDSFDYLNFMIGLDRRLGVTIPEADYASVSTLDYLVAYLAKRIPA
jgi:acyl carrier protein